MVTGLARDGSPLAVLLGAVWATGFAGDGEVLAVLAEAELLAPLSFLGGAYPPEFPLLLVCELGLWSADGTLVLDGAGPLVGGPLADFASGGLGVASVCRHGEDENAVERTAYCPRVRGIPFSVAGRCALFSVLATPSPFRQRFRCSCVLPMCHTLQSNPLPRCLTALENCRG